MAIPGVDDLLAVSISGKQTNMLVSFNWSNLIIQNKFSSSLQVLKIEVESLLFN